MNFKEFEKILLKDVNFKKEYYNHSNIAFEISEIILEARIIKGITQLELAKKMKTQQSSIARVENGKTLPSLRFLLEMAEALDTELISPTFKVVQELSTSEYLNKQNKSNTQTMISNLIGNITQKVSLFKESEEEKINWNFQYNK